MSSPTSPPTSPLPGDTGSSFNKPRKYKWVASKINKLLKGDINDFSKMIKLLQYMSVITCEYDLHMGGCNFPKVIDKILGS